MLFQDVDRLKTRLSQLRPLSKAELARLRQEFIIESSYNSNAIEGNTLTLRETAMVLNDGVTIAGKSIRDHLDIIGFKDAFHFLFELVETHEELSERVIKDIHALVLMGNSEKGCYRRIPVRILGAENEPTPPYLIEEEMKTLLRNYLLKKQENHPLVAIAWLHLAFESIHPFIDGNGRTGRLLLNFELMKQGYLPVDIKFTDRERYYQCFDHYHKNQQNPQMLAEMIAQYEKAELEHYLAIIEAIE